MFLLGNLSRHGLFERNHPHGTRYFLWENDGQVGGAFGVTNGGYLMCQAPNAPCDAWRAFARAIVGHTLVGMTGAPDQVTRTFAAIGLGADAFSLDEVEPLYKAEIATLHAPEATLRPVTESDRTLLQHWFRGYVQETEPKRANENAAGLAEAHTERAINTIDTQLMLEGDAPSAMTAVSARTQDIAVIGGVHVPPSLRGAGRGGRVVAAHLRALARKTSLNAAILFSQNRYAARSYERVGFRQIGQMRVARLMRPYRVPELRAGRESQA